MNKEIQILDKVVNQNSLFVIAEAGNQFNGNKQTALDLVDASADAGADAVKFIFWFPDEILADKELLYTYETVSGLKTEPMYDLLDRIRLSMTDWQDVMLRCSKRNILMMATINSPSGVDFAMCDGLDLPAIKLSTWDWNFMDLWKWVANSGKPTFVDTGAVTVQEIQRNIRYFRKARNSNLVLLHCFHTKDPMQMNMNSIPYLRDTCNCLVGYSATDYHDDLDVMALGLGACVLEKRITISRQGGVLHDSLSKEPGEFKEYVKRMRELKSSMGRYDVIPSDVDLSERKKWFRRIVADEDIKAGDEILRPMLEAKRGETGLDPAVMDDLLGKVALRDIKRNETIKIEDVCQQ